MEKHFESEDGRFYVAIRKEEDGVIVPAEEGEPGAFFSLYRIADESDRADGWEPGESIHVVDHETEEEMIEEAMQDMRLMRINSPFGFFLADRGTGNIQFFRSEGVNLPTPLVLSITRFDVPEWLVWRNITGMDDESFRDYLAFGFTTRDGQTIPPSADYRAHVVREARRD